MLLSMLLALWTTSAEAYTPVAGLSFASVALVEDTTFAHGWHLRVRAHRRAETAYPDDLLAQALYMGTLQSMRAARRLGAENKLCRPGAEIDLYEIREDALNDPRRFPARFIGGGDTGRGPLWGYFDPMPSDRLHDVIVVSPQTPQSSYRIAAHEIAHYWYSVLCLDRVTDQSSEAFAKAIEPHIGVYTPPAPPAPPAPPVPPVVRGVGAPRVPALTLTTAPTITLRAAETVVLTVTPTVLVATPVVLEVREVRLSSR